MQSVSHMQSGYNPRKPLQRNHRGATNDIESNGNHSLKRRLRRTRGELILQEYEDEIETLIKQNEDLKSKNLRLQSQLKTALEPSTSFFPQNETEAVDLCVLEESTKKLKAANQLYQKVKQDMEKLKEANKTLRSQNVDLIQENMRLKAEVESRSPQKYGRYTVAALEAKILQNEREVAQLKKALERSDKYIEELEAQASTSQRDGGKIKEDSQPEGSASGEMQTGDGGATLNCSRIATMQRSLGEKEEVSVCTGLERKSINLPNGHGYLLTTSDMCPGIGNLVEGLSSQNDMLQNIIMPIPSTPSTPSSGFSSLSLKSPAVCCNKKTSFKHLTYLRRLSFDDGCSSSSFCATASGDQSFKVSQVDSGDSLSQRNISNSDNGVLWSGWQDTKATNPATFLSTNENTAEFKEGVSQDASTLDYDDSSEVSMDLAYHDQISELDSMMAHTPDINVPLIPGGDMYLLTDPRSATEKHSTTGQDGSRSGPGNVGESTKRKCPISLSTASPSKLSRVK
ncbi:ORC ubiquitin ligase 1 isoform X2 [Hoplias malabaricus]|uniref:ORC ubiquitin ligase 1 isoform X2 n=1 Tax=Hoplias malabaricus TaxID=27720 RepID=UPI003461AE05